VRAGADKRITGWWRDGGTGEWRDGGTGEWNGAGTGGRRGGRDGLGRMWLCLIEIRQVPLRSTAPGVPAGTSAAVALA